MRFTVYLATPHQGENPEVGTFQLDPDNYPRISEFIIASHSEAIRLMANHPGRVATLVGPDPRDPDGDWRLRARTTTPVPLQRVTANGTADIDDPDIHLADVN